MEKHIKSRHTNTVSCGECGNRFPDVKTCEDHMAAQHAPSIEPFPCEVCGLVLVNFITLQEHVRKQHVTNGRSEMFTCQVCNLTLPDFPTLAKHTQEHRQVREFACTECDYETYLYTDLCKHKMTHEGGQTQTSDSGESLANVLISQQTKYWSKLRSLKQDGKSSLKI